MHSLGIKPGSRLIKYQHLRLREVEFKDKKLKRKKKPQVKLYKCIRCGLCERHCPTTPAAIYLKNELSDSGTDSEAVVT